MYVFDNFNKCRTYPRIPEPISQNERNPQITAIPQQQQHTNHRISHQYVAMQTTASIVSQPNPRMHCKLPSTQPHMMMIIIITGRKCLSGLIDFNKLIICM